MFKINFESVDQIREDFEQNLTYDQMVRLVGSTLNIEDVDSASGTPIGYMGEVIAVDLMITQDRNGNRVVRWLLLTEDDLVLPVTNSMRWKFLKGPI